MTDKAFQVKNGLQVNSVFTVDPAAGIANLSGNLVIGANVLYTAAGDIIGNSTINVRTTATSIAFNNAFPTLPLTLTQTTSQMGLPVGNTAQRATGANGHFRYNTDFSALEAFTGSAWSTIPAAAASNADVQLGTNTAAFVPVASLFGAAAPVSVAFATTITMNLASGLNFQIGNLTANVNFANVITGLNSGRSGLIMLPTNGKTVSFGTMWNFPTGGHVSVANDAIAYLVWNSSMIVANYITNYTAG